MKLKQAALTFARKRWADYILVTSSAPPPPPYLVDLISFNAMDPLHSALPNLSLQFADTDNVLTNPDTLNLLIAENKSVVAPMLDSTGAYSNFWCGITPQVSPWEGTGPIQFEVVSVACVHQVATKDHMSGMQVCSENCFKAIQLAASNI